MRYGFKERQVIERLLTTYVCVEDSCDKKKEVKTGDKFFISIPDKLHKLFVYFVVSLLFLSFLFSSPLSFPFSFHLTLYFILNQTTACETTLKNRWKTEKDLKMEEE